MKQAHRTSKAVLAALLLTSSGCMTFQREVWSPEPSPASNAPAQLHVTNHHGFPLDVYAIGGGTVYRMGTVLPGLSGSFTLRPAMLATGPVEFVARAGERNPPIRSGRLLLVPGNTVDFDIGVHALNSMAVVKR